MKKISILFIHSALVCGGAEQALFDLCCLLDRTKFEVTVLVQHPGAEWDQKFRNAGIPVIDIWDCQRKGNNPIVKLGNYVKRKRISNFLKNEAYGLMDFCFHKKYDIIVSYGIFRNHKMGLSRYAKTVKYIHGDMGTNEPYRKNILDMKELLPVFDSIVCVSNTAMHSFEEMTGITDRVAMYWNPLNSSQINRLSEEKIGLPEDIPVVCAVGRLSLEKGFDRLIRIHREILNMDIPHKLVIVGDGPEKEHLLQIVEETGTQDSVIMPGYTPNPYPYMKNCRFMVCSSYTEGLPVIAMESLSLGVPIVSAYPSVGELFGEETCGIITGNDDDSLREGIIQMLTDGEYYLSAKAGAEKRSGTFDGRKMVSKVEDIFINLVESK